MTIREWIAQRLRFAADRIDRHGAPKMMTAVLGFTFESGVGVVFRDDGRGCPLWYYGDDDYERAHDESGLPKDGRLEHLWVPYRVMKAGGAPV